MYRTTGYVHVRTYCTNLFTDCFVNAYLHTIQLSAQSKLD